MLCVKVIRRGKGRCRKVCKARHNCACEFRRLCSSISLAEAVSSCKHARAGPALARSEGAEGGGRARLRELWSAAQTPASSPGKNSEWPYSVPLSLPAPLWGRNLLRWVSIHGSTCQQGQSWREGRELQKGLGRNGRMGRRLLACSCCSIALSLTSGASARNTAAKMQALQQKTAAPVGSRPSMAPPRAASAQAQRTAINMFAKPAGVAAGPVPRARVVLERRRLAERLIAHATYQQGSQEKTTNPLPIIFVSAEVSQLSQPQVLKAPLARRPP